MALRGGRKSSLIHEVEALVVLCDRERWSIIEALVRRILEVQETAGEAELLAMIAYVEALLVADARRPH